MAGVTSGDAWDTKKEVANNDRNEVKYQLEGWREALLPLNRLLNWDKPYYPACIFGFITFIFLLIWYFDTSVLTTLCIFGLLITLTDFLVPIIGPNIIATQQWTGIQERQFEQICERISNFRHHVSSFVQGLSDLKTDRPKAYFVIVVAVLSLTAWIGSCVNNLLLIYLTTTFLALLPGLRRHGIIQKYFNSIWSIVKATILRKKDAKKVN